MENTEKIARIQAIIDQNDPNIVQEACYAFLYDTGDIKKNYMDYANTSPFNFDKELERLPEADYELSTAFLTMVLRGDHFTEGAFKASYEKGQINAILEHMIQTLS